jgi:NADH-quinone oxidoreductase subunit H
VIEGLFGVLLPYLLALIKIIVVVTIILLSAAVLSLLERKFLGRLQVRHGPMRVGWHGILQPFADAVKLLGKEFIIPAAADKPLFILAPVICLIFAAVPFTVVSWGPPPWFIISDLNIGLVFILALSSMGTYGVILGGWASNSKYAVLGALRAVAQMISYELPLVLALVGPLMLAGTLSMAGIVNSQAQAGVWYIFLQPIAFVCYILAGVAETQRIPFDMLEDEGALVTGFYTEYSGMAFSLFAMAEYGNMVLIGAVFATTFLGGWMRPFPSIEALAFLDYVPSIVWFIGKSYLFVLFAIWLRGTLPRVRYDQLMYFGWKVLVPLTLVNILITGMYKVLNWHGAYLLVYYGLTLVLSLICLAFASKYFYQRA